MLLNLGLSFLLLLLVLLIPQAQSGRVRFSAQRPRHHSHAHLHAINKASENETPKPHIQMVTGSSVQHPHIVMSPGLDPGSIAPSLVVSGPNPGGNSNTLVANILDTPVSGPSPGGNSATLGNALFGVPVSGLNPAGNSQILDVGSGPNPDGNSDTLVANMLDTPVSGSNPGGNLQILAASSGPNPSSNSEILATNSRPNPRGSSEGLIHSDSNTLLGNVGGIFVAASKASSSSEPKPSRNFVQSVRSPAMSDPNASQEKEILQAGGIIFSELPRAPVPPSGPSPSHNSAVTQQGLFAERKLKEVIIGCEQEEG
eukprot:c10962_g1_i1 orf=315-1256(-)